MSIPKRDRGRRAAGRCEAMSNEEKILSMLSEMRSDIQEIKSDVAGLKRKWQS